jgi:RNA polymerase sigma-70 factor (ECF subfamily)
VDFTQNILKPVNPAWDWAGLRTSCVSEARRILRDPHEAEEAAQEALVRAWRQRDRCRDPQTPIPWLRRIARNEALRLIERKPSAVFTELSPETASSGEGEPPLEALVERLAVWQALARLSAPERELVVLRYIDDLAQPEIATRLGIPEATVRVRLHRIRKRLGALIEPPL